MTCTLPGAAFNCFGYQRDGRKEGLILVSLSIVLAFILVDSTSYEGGGVLPAPPNDRMCNDSSIRQTA